MTAEKQKILMIIRPAEGGMVSHLQALINNLAEDFAITLACPEKQAAKYSALPCEILSLPLASNLRPVWDAAVLPAVPLVKKNDFSIHARFKAGLLAKLSTYLKFLPADGTILPGQSAGCPEPVLAERCLSAGRRVILRFPAGWPANCTAC